jgi:threonine aldolase
MIELRSDTFTKPTPEMLAAVQDAELGDDVYGEDPTVRRLESLAAELLGKESACLAPSGTMANLASILAHCERGRKAIVGDESDIFLYEAGGPSVCGGVVLEPLRTARDGRLPLEELEEALTVDAVDPQFSLPGLVCLETPHNRCGGVVLPLDYLRDAARLTRRAGVPLHLDGARIFNAAVALGVDAADVAAHADSVQFCLSKGLSAPIGSVVAGGADFVAGVRRVRKMLGGGMRQAGIVAAPGIVALEQMVERLAEDHANARRLAEGLAGLEGIDLDLDFVQTNVVVFRVPGVPWRRFLRELRRCGVAASEFGHGRIRMVTHAGISAEDAERAVEAAGEALAALRAGVVPAPAGASAR